MSAPPDKRQHKPTKRFGKEAEPTTSSKQQKTIAAKSTAKVKLVKPTTPLKKSTNRSPSVEVEEIDDPADQPKSNPPCNPAHILERADGTDKNDESPVCTAKGKGKRTVIPDSEDENSEPVNSEPASESAEAELSVLLRISFLSLLYNTSRARDTRALPRSSYLASMWLALTHVAMPPLCMTRMDS